MLALPVNFLLLFFLIITFSFFFPVFIELYIFSPSLPSSLLPFLYYLSMSDLACKYSLKEKDLMVCIAWKEHELEWVGQPLELVLFFSKADVFQSLNS